MKSSKSPIELEIDPVPVCYIGPATRDNPMSQVRTKLFGNVIFRDQKIKWSRVTLHFKGTASFNMEARTSTLPPDLVNSQYELRKSNSSTTHLKTTVTLCDVEKELIYNHEDAIDFGFYLPPYLPPNIKTNHSSVEYTLSVTCSTSGTFPRTVMIEDDVTVCRHYLPSPSCLIPSVEHHGAREWFEWSADIPKATPIEAGEIVIGLRWSVEKEAVEVDRVEFWIEELETYRFSTKSGVHRLPSLITPFPSTTYHPPTFSNSSETHFIRTPIPSDDTLRTHHFDPFLEITHRLQLKIHFVSSTIRSEPFEINFPIIITDFPPNTKTDYLPPPATLAQPAGDEMPCADLELPEYTPCYQPHIP